MHSKHSGISFVTILDKFVLSDLLRCLPGKYLTAFTRLARCEIGHILLTVCMVFAVPRLLDDKTTSYWQSYVSIKHRQVPNLLLYDMCTWRHILTLARQNVRHVRVNIMAITQLKSFWNGTFVSVIFIAFVASRLLCWASGSRATNSPPHVHNMCVSYSC